MENQEASNWILVGFERLTHQEGKTALHFNSIKYIQIIYPTIKIWLTIGLSTLLCLFPCNLLRKRTKALVQNTAGLKDIDRFLFQWPFYLDINAFLTSSYTDTAALPLTALWYESSMSAWSFPFLGLFTYKCLKTRTICFFLACVLIILSCLLWSKLSEGTYRKVIKVAFWVIC